MRTLAYLIIAYDYKTNNDWYNFSYSFQFTCRDAGAILGAMLVGVVFRRYRWFLSYGCALALCAVITTVVPLAESFIQVAAAVLVHGVLLGFLDCGKYD